MVAPALTRALAAVAALAAIGYLVVMVVTGALPQQRQRVQFEAKGVMRVEPARVVRVELTRGTDRAVLVRDGAGWLREGAGPLAAPLAEKLSLAVQYMHTSAPVRVLEPAELGGNSVREFGLDRPAVSIALHGESGPLLRARFGGRTPDDMLQYVTIEGRDGVVLLSRFVGAEWSAIAEGVYSMR